MSKEMFVSLTPHETKVAVNEDDLLAEIYYERENEYTLAGSIYKGRVTRVLPGMQSAFVEIGLERDAFLYVSDFLELEDEDEQVETVRVQQPPQREQRPFERRERGPRNGGDRSAGASQVTQQPESEPEPEAYFTNNHEPAPTPTVFEGGEGFDEQPQQPEAAPAPRPPEQHDREARGGWRGRRGRRGRRGGFGETRFPDREDQHRESGEPRRERENYGPPPGYQPIILPGESISKYRNAAPASFVPGPVETGQPECAESEPSPTFEAAETQTETASHEPPVIEAPAFQQEYAETPVTETAEHIAEKQEETAPVYRETRYQPYPEASAAREEPEEKDKERFDQMNVATVFGGEEATRADVPTEDAPAAAAEPLQDRNIGVYGGSEESTHELAETSAPQMQEQSSERHDQPRFTATPHRSFEEEVIEEEEADLPQLAEHHDDVSEFEELEEETLEPMQAAGHVGEPIGEMLTEAVEETDEEQAIEEEEIDENGYEASEDSEDEEEPIEEGEAASAELRGPSGTAPYQQRAQRPSPGFDRRRGRRGGRRMRGGQRISMQRQQVQISDILKEGQEILVQIAKEPIGKKGARITSHIALPGRFMVFMPTVNHIGVSRKISSDEERQRLKRIVGAERNDGHGGFIVRTAAEGVSEEELKQDIHFLKGLWNEIKTRADNSKSPALIYHDLNLVERLLRDLLSEDFTHVWVDNEAEYERILRFVNRFQPNLVRRVRLYTKETPLFEQFGIQDEINKALKSTVWLKSGGYIVINQTEALVAIDVNTGKYVGKTTRLEDTIVKTNVDAINEIVRQIRLRDLGGIIVIDFIDMDERKNRQKVMQALEEALKNDRAPSKVLQFNDFGLVAITRKRVKHSLERVLGQPCPVCTGTGLVKSVETVCNEIYVEMKKLRRQFEGREIMLRVNPEVGKQLKANNAKWLNDLEELTGKTIIIKSDASLHPEQFDM